MASIPMEQDDSPQNGAQWNGVEYVNAGSYGNASPGGEKDLPVLGLSYKPGFVGPPKKMTRDGQPAKRRGPKPDSKPAQTRRQELNRQAQRTHRERKEQYIKTLEIEISGLREGYAADVTAMNNSIAQLREALRQQQDENVILKETLRARGIALPADTDQRRSPMAAISAKSSAYGGSNNTQTRQGGAFPSASSVTPAGTSIGALTPSPRMTDRSFGNGMGSVAGSSTNGTSYHSHSPPDPGVMEQGISIKREMSAVPEMPGVFEQNPQLGIDFILALEHTCRDHGEYLVRRSVNSPDDPEEAQISGHALMASCPPPNHIKNTPAQQAGLQPTYPHQVPQIPYENLLTLLNLSRRIVEQGVIEGGQITPVMALQHLKSHNRYHTLTAVDVKAMIKSLDTKVRCYGFGAVMEDFELMDAMSSIFATKVETYEDTFRGEVDIDDMYS